jgi:hypothetical protein
MKRIYRKQPTLALRELVPDFQENGPDNTYELRTFVASMGKDDVCRFSYIIRDTDLLLVDLNVYAHCQGFGVESLVLGVLDSLESTKRTLVLAPLSRASEYLMEGYTPAARYLLLEKGS